MRYYRIISQKLSKKDVFVKLAIIVEVTKLNNLDNFA